MARILALDYGLKRTGIAVTDPLQIIATGLTTVETSKLMEFLANYFQKETVERIIIGEPKNLDDSDTHASAGARQMISRLKKKYPAIPVEAVDERYTSKMAIQSMIDMGMKKKDRRKKANVDEIAATILLQEYLGRSGG